MGRVLDYVVAMAIFLGGFALVFGLVSNYAHSYGGDVDTAVLKSQASYIQNLVMTTSNISGSYTLRSIGLLGDSYVFDIVVNNSDVYYKDMSGSRGDLINEMVYFDVKELGFSNYDTNSVYIYDGTTGEEVPYTQSGYPYGFLVNVSYNSAKTYVVYFDETSNFTMHSVGMFGADNISEMSYMPRRADVLQYRRMARLSQINYTQIGDGIRFNIAVSHTNGTVFWSYGDRVPEDTDVVSAERMVLFQDSRGSVNTGRLSVRVW